MNIKTLLLGLCGIPTVLASSNIPDSEKRAIVNQLNKARRDDSVHAAGMPIMSWDNALESALLKYKADNSGGAIAYNGWSLLNEPAFKAFKDKGYIPLYHDTCKSAKDVAGIFAFRNKQARCFDLSKCSTTTFNNYASCFKNPIPPKINCNWSWQYYPKFIDDQQRTIACVSTGIRGTYAPAKQNDSFWCYGKNTRKDSWPQKDLPFTEGDNCTKCPDDLPVCVNKLCTPKLALR